MVRRLAATHTLLVLLHNRREIQDPHQPPKRRQHPLARYILDFYCPELHLAIELDGGQHSLPQNRQADSQRTADLEQKHGVTVIRFWDHEILTQPDVALNRILSVIERLSSKRTHAQLLGPAPSSRNP
jgi:very-short-patch-repair endonuclease